MFFKEKIIKNYIEYDFSQNVRNNNAMLKIKQRKMGV